MSTTIFWEIRVILLINYLQKGKTATGDYYVSFFDKLKTEIVKKRSHLDKKKVFFTSCIGMAKIHESHFKLIDHAPYSPNLAIGDFFLFPYLKI